MLDSLSKRENKISVVGLGYVGLPLALAFGRVFDVVGYDKDEKKIGHLLSGEDPAKEITREEFSSSEVQFTSDAEELRKAQFHVIAVPTPIGPEKEPDLSALIKATEQIAVILKSGDFVVYESTVYPGCTEEVCLPILETISGLILNRDFYLGYSPERINPGDSQHSLSKVVKVVSGSSEYAKTEISGVYSKIIEAGIHEAPSIKVAEAAKVIENTQRDLNIALVNELAIIFDRLGLDTISILEAAGTKWNFMPFYPGLVGGHCIGIDPYYLTYKAKQSGYIPQLILSGRGINDSMPSFIAGKISEMLAKVHKIVPGARVLQYGITFKENVVDTRNSKAADLAKCLIGMGMVLEIFDPVVDPAAVENEYGLKMVRSPSGDYDVVVIAVAHQEFKNIRCEEYANRLAKNGLLIDIKGILNREELSEVSYWRL